MVNLWDRLSPITGVSGSKLNGVLTAREYKEGNPGKRSSKKGDRRHRAASEINHTEAASPSVSPAVAKQTPVRRFS